MSIVKKVAVPKNLKDQYEACYYYKISEGASQRIYVNRQDIIDALDLLIKNETEDNKFRYVILNLLEKYYTKITDKTN